MTSILIPPSLPPKLKPPPSPPTPIINLNLNLNLSIINAKKRSRKTTPNFRSLKQAFSFAKSLANLFQSQMADPLNLLLLLLLGDGGGGGGGGLGFLTGGSGGEWWGRRRRGKRTGLIALAVVSVAVAVLGVGEMGEWGRMVRVLVPSVVGVGFKVKVWGRHWMGILLLFGFGIFLLLQLREKKMRFF